MSTTHWELISKSAATNFVMGTYNGSKVIPLGKQTWFMHGVESNQELKLSHVS
jgi:hypothetical protein